MINKYKRALIDAYSQIWRYQSASDALEIIDLVDELAFMLLSPGGVQQERKISWHQTRASRQYC